MQLTVREVAQHLNVPEKTIYRWINEGSIPAQKVGEQYRFNKSELLEWAVSKGVSVPAAIFTNRDPDGAPPSLSAAIEAGGVAYDLAGEDKESVLRSAVDAMRLPVEVDREALLRVLIARESLASTGIGDGIAIPHVRNPIVLHVTSPMVTVCFLKTPVEYDALDGKPIHCLFTMVSPTVRQHLLLLSQLAFALRDPGFKGAIQRQAAREEFLAELQRVEAGLAHPGAASYGKV